MPRVSFSFFASAESLVEPSSNSTLSAVLDPDGAVLFDSNCSDGKVALADYYSPQLVFSGLQNGSVTIVPTDLGYSLCRDNLGVCMDGSVFLHAISMKFSLFNQSNISPVSNTLIFFKGCAYRFAGEGDFELFPNTQYSINSIKRISYRNIESRLTGSQMLGENLKVRVSLLRRSGRAFAEAVFFIKARECGFDDKNMCMRDISLFQKNLQLLENPFYALYVFYQPGFTQDSFLAPFDQTIFNWNPTPKKVKKECLSKGSAYAPLCSLVKQAMLIKDIRLMEVSGDIGDCE